MTLILVTRRMSQQAPFYIVKQHMFSTAFGKQ